VPEFFGVIDERKERFLPFRTSPRATRRTQWWGSSEEHGHKDVKMAVTRRARKRQTIEPKDALIVLQLRCFGKT